MLEDLLDPQTGEPQAIVIVTDNGSCYRAKGLQRYIGSRPEFEHVRTRHRAPETNGVIERSFQSLKYEHLYLQEIDDGLALAEHVATFERLYNDERPHEAIDWALPRDRYLQTPAATRRRHDRVDEHRDHRPGQGCPGPHRHPAAPAGSCHP